MKLRNRREPKFCQRFTLTKIEAMISEMLCNQFLTEKSDDDLMMILDKECHQDAVDLYRRIEAFDEGNLMDNAMNYCYPSQEDNSLFYGDFSLRVLNDDEEAVVSILDSFLTPEKCLNVIEHDEVPAMVMENTSANVVSDNDEWGDSTHGDSIVEAVYSHIADICPPKVKLVLGDRLKEIISSLCYSGSNINPLTIKRLMKNHFNVKLFKSKNEKNFLFAIEVILKAAVVYCLSFRKDSIFDKFKSVGELLEEYPSFVQEDLDASELEYLLAYRNMMRIALEIIPAKCNKRLLMNICSTLEGSGKVYITGGTQSLSTCRRVLIYERESDMKPKRRPERRNQSLNKSSKTYGVTSCDCGSVILMRTVWRHKKSKRHLAYLERIGSSA